MPKHEVLEILVDAEKDALRVAEDANKAADKIVLDADVEIADLQKEMKTQSSLKRNNLDEMIAVETEQMQGDSQKRIDSEYAAMDAGVEKKKSAACAMVVEVLEGR